MKSFLLTALTLTLASAFASASAIPAQEPAANSPESNGSDDPDLHARTDYNVACALGQQIGVAWYPKNSGVCDTFKKSLVYNYGNAQVQDAAVVCDDVRGIAYLPRTQFEDNGVRAAILEAFGKSVDCAQV